MMNRLWYSMAFDFHLRPSRDIEIAQRQFGFDHFLIEEICARSDFPFLVTVEIGHRNLIQKQNISIVLGPLIVPIDMSKSDAAIVRIENASHGTRKWNRGQFVLHGKVWDSPSPAGEIQRCSQ